MTDSPNLTPREWTLLHQVMDRVDHERHTRPGPDVDAGRVRELAMATYKSQGIEVDEATLDRALETTLARGQLGGAIAGMPKPRGVDTELLAQEVRQIQGRDAALARHSGTMGVDRFLKVWDAKASPYLRHRPGSDADLDAILVAAIRDRMGQWRTWCYARGLGLAATGLFLAVAGAGAIGVLGEAWAWMALFAPAGALAAWPMHLLAGTQAQVLAALGRGREALGRGDHDHADLALALKLAGQVVVGRLSPATGKALEALVVRGRALGGRAKSAHVLWEKWQGRLGQLRENDIAVLERLVAVHYAHPFRAAARLHEAIETRNNLKQNNLELMGNQLITSAQRAAKLAKLKMERERKESEAMVREHMRLAEHNKQALERTMRGREPG